MHATTSDPVQTAATPHLLDASMFWNGAGGVRRVLSARHERLGPLGWRHSVLAPGAQGDGLHDCGGLPLPRSGGYRVVLGTGQAQRQMQQLAPDLIESADPYALGWAALAAAERLRVPALACCHSDLPALAARLVGGPRGTSTWRGQQAQRWARRYLVNLYRHFDAVLAPSHGLAERLRAWGVPRVEVQPLGVDCAVFNPQAHDVAWRGRLLRAHDLAPTTRLFVYTGRFAVEKHLDLLVDAVRLLGPGHVLLAVGEGPRLPRDVQVIRMHAIADARRLARAVASSDVYVHAGDQESFGLGALEAMACGTPVVVAGSGGLAELVGDAGLQVAHARPAAWAEAMQASLGHGNAVQRRAALHRARQHDWPLVIAQMARRYTALLQRSAATVPTPTPDTRGLAALAARS